MTAPTDEIAHLQPDVEQVLAGMLLATGPAAHELPVDQARANHLAETESLCGDGEPPVAEEIDFAVPASGGEIPVRAYVPRGGTAPLPLIVCVHGGGWMLGSVETFARRCGAGQRLRGARAQRRVPPRARASATRRRSRTRSPRLPWAASEAVAGLGGDPARVAVAATRRAATSRRSWRGGCATRSTLRLQALVYPVTDAASTRRPTASSPTGFGLTALTMQRFWASTSRGRTAPSPTPLRCATPTCRASPPALVLTADHDVLRDEGEAYATALEARRGPGRPCALARARSTASSAGRRPS